MGGILRAVESQTFNVGLLQMSSNNIIGGVVNGVWHLEKFPVQLLD